MHDGRSEDRRHSQGAVGAHRARHSAAVAAAGSVAAVVAAAPPMRDAAVVVVAEVGRRRRRTWRRWRGDSAGHVHGQSRRERPTYTKPFEVLEDKWFKAR